jgi:hypothetical protein
MRFAVSRVPRVDNWSIALFRLAVLLIAVGVAGCAVRLAPAFDRAIIDGLNRTNEEAMIFFASVVNGGSAGTFPRRQNEYNSLQGKLETLVAMAKARGNPPPPAAGVAVLGVFAGASAPQQADALVEPPTMKNVEAMIRIVNDMRFDDSRGRLTAAQVAFQKNNFITQMNYALTYEKMLDR